VESSEIDLQLGMEEARCSSICA